MVVPRLRVRSQANLSRLAVVYANPTRLRIVTELWMREMSPQTYWSAFGGGTLKSIERHFKILTEYGWLRLVEKKKVGDRGWPQSFYRATEAAVFDTKTWCSLPYSIRFAFSCGTFEQLIERVVEAMKAGTFDARDDRHLSWVPLALDQHGWDRVISRLDALFESLSEEQADAKIRLDRSDEEPILMTVGLAGFQSPSPDQLEAEIQYPTSIPVELSPAMSLDSPMPFSTRLAKVFADPLNLKIVTETNLRAMSAKQLHQELGPDLSDKVFHRRIKILVELGWLTKVDSKTGGSRRGAKEHFYRALGPAVFDPHRWSHVPLGDRPEISWRTFQQLSEKVQEAMQAGTFDARCERHWTWSLLRLDQIGWEQVIAALKGVFEFLFEERDAANSRLARSHVEPVVATVCLLGFESPSQA